VVVYLGLQISFQNEQTIKVKRTLVVQKTIVMEFQRQQLLLLLLNHQLLTNHLILTQIKRMSQAKEGFNLDACKIIMLRFREQEVNCNQK